MNLNQPTNQPWSYKKLKKTQFDFALLTSIWLFLFILRFLKAYLFSSIYYHAPNIPLFVRTVFINRQFLDIFPQN